MKYKSILILTVICLALALLVGCAADVTAAKSIVGKFWSGWRDLKKATILNTLADKVTYEVEFIGFPVSSTLNAEEIADTFTDPNKYWGGCTDRAFVISKTTEYPESKLIIVESQASWMEDGDQVKYNLHFTLSKINSRWRITKVKHILI